MSAWSDSVLVTEATNAGSANEVTRLIPRLLHHELADWPESTSYGKYPN